MSSNTARATPWVVLAGVVGATCDITYALLYYGWRGVPAQRLLQTVASGLLGKASYDGGWPTAALGLACHYAIVAVTAESARAEGHRLPPEVLDVSPKRASGSRWPLRASPARGRVNGRRTAARPVPGSSPTAGP